MKFWPFQRAFRVSGIGQTGSKLGQIGRNVPRNANIPREEAPKSRYFFDKKKAPWWDA